MWMIKPICMCVAFLLVSSPAWSQMQTPDPSLRYQVVDIAADDRLNVRRQAGVEAEIIGSLLPDAVDVVITGAAMEIAGSDWWEIVFVEGYLSRGWVNGRYLEVMDRDERDRDYPLMCGGTEPFWSLEVENGQARYSSPDEQQYTMTASEWRKARGRLGTFAVQLERDGQIGYATMWREPTSCSDGMSDTGYPFGTVLIRPDGEVLAGCCRRWAQ
jgi:uncharacterized membrane protein